MEFVVIRNNQESQDELCHHGTKGMKWGVRRFQNKDGSLTPEGQKRRSLGQTIHDYKVKKKRKAALEKARATKEANKKAAEEEKVKAENRLKAVLKGRVPAHKMTDDELKIAYDRRKAEKDYHDKLLEASGGRRFLSKVWNDAVVPGITEGGKRAVSNFINDTVSDLLGLNKKEQKSALDLAKEAADMAKYKKNKFEDEKSLEQQIKQYKRYKESGTDETLEEFTKREKAAREQINKESKGKKTYNEPISNLSATTQWTGRQYVLSGLLPDKNIIYVPPSDERDY